MMSEGESAKNTFEGTNPPSAEKVRTLVVTGLPYGVTQRSLARLFRSYDGYEGAFIDRHPKLIVFAIFSTREDAERVKNDLDGCMIIPTKRLCIRFAYSNSREHPNRFNKYLPKSVSKLPIPHSFPVNPWQMTMPQFVCSDGCIRSWRTHSS